MCKFRHIWKQLAKTMNKYQIVFLGYVFLWSLCILDCRTVVCRRSILWTLIITIFGMILVSSSVAINCYLSYHEGLTSAQFDLNVVLDTLLLLMTNSNKDLFYWHTSTIGNSLVISGLGIPIMCRLLRRGVIPEKKSRE